MNILFIGKPGSGKGTLCQYIMESFPNFIHLSTGDLLREAALTKTPIGLEVDSLLRQGKFATDQITIELTKNFLTINQDKHIIFDGYPRNLMQANLCENQKIKFDIIFHLEISDKELFDRVPHRLIHSKSGRIYNNKYYPPKKHGVDDLTGEVLIKRNDDNIKSLAKRLKIYKDITLPILDFYKKKQTIYKLDTSIKLQDQYKFVNSVILSYLGLISTITKVDPYSRHSRP